MWEAKIITFMLSNLKVSVISCKVPGPVFVMRGADSELFLQETADEMQTRGPQTHVKVYEGYGHIPTMVPDNQVADVVNWLLAEDDAPALRHAAE